MATTITLEPVTRTTATRTRRTRTRRTRRRARATAPSPVMATIAATRRPSRSRVVDRNRDTGCATVATGARLPTRLGGGDSRPVPARRVGMAPSDPSHTSFVVRMPEPVLAALPQV
jgi:hypothetical protein